MNESFRPTWHIHDICTGGWSQKKKPFFGAAFFCSENRLYIYDVCVPCVNGAVRGKEGNGPLFSAGYWTECDGGIILLTRMPVCAGLLTT